MGLLDVGLGLGHDSTLPRIRSIVVGVSMLILHVLTYNGFDLEIVIELYWNFLDSYV